MVKRGRVREIYFAGGAGVEAGAQMLTCYSRTYGKRPYPIAAKGECSDPRCCGVANHRRHSELGLSPGEWRGAMMAKHLRELHVCLYLCAACLKKLIAALDLQVHCADMVFLVFSF